MTDHDSNEVSLDDLHAEWRMAVRIQADVQDLHNALVRCKEHPRYIEHAIKMAAVLHARLTEDAEFKEACYTECLTELITREMRSVEGKGKRKKGK